MAKKPFFTAEDAKTSFNLFCCIYGIGTLGMPGNFARAGPTIAVVAMAFMAFANIYSSVAMSKVMLLAPKSVKTFGDLGEWAMGQWGRWLCVISQMGSCLLIPCVFLVLGGSLLDGLFPDAFEQTTWTILMALTVLPVCLVPTLKEGSGAAFAGCLGTIIADVIGVAVVMHGMRGHRVFRSRSSSFRRWLVSLAICPLPTVLHSDPTRMPRVVGVTVGFISCLFLVLASTAYSATGMTNLGFAPNWGIVVLAYIFMQLHITIAFSVIVNPAFYLAEQEPRRSSKMSYVSVADAENEHKGDVEEEMAEYRGGLNTIKYIVLRVIIIVILVVLAIVFKDHFSDFADFVGASCITTNCILLPITFYLIKAWGRLPMYEKIPAIIVTIVCFVLGCYVTTRPAKAFPILFGHVREHVYYNYTAAHES
ncbi:Amino acid transporter, transmembrane domain [Phytophthora cactorum]|nr:Amino acid transporter, transmembrane domain [Phytophthora cactorum]